VGTYGGKSWEAARFSPLGQPAPQPYAWVHWEYNRKIPGPGSYELACRATDESGRIQPAKRPMDRAHHYELTKHLTNREGLRGMRDGDTGVQLPERGHLAHGIWSTAFPWLLPAASNASVRTIPG